MSAALEKFLKQRLTQPPVVAWSARLADRTTLTHCCNDSLTPGQVEQTLNELIDAANRLHHIQPRRFCWAFERAKIYIALLDDGACLSVFVENCPGAAFAEVETALEEFSAMKL